MQQFSPLVEAPRRAESFERKRERETAGGGFANCQGKEGGWGAGGWSGGVKGTGDFATKFPNLMHVLQVFCFYGSDSVAIRIKDPETNLPRKRFAKHIKP